MRTRARLLIRAARPGGIQTREQEQYVLKCVAKATPQIARIARDAGALVVAVVTKPFSHEGRQRMLRAEEGVRELQQYCDCSIVIPNDRLIVSGKGVSLVNAFKPADDILRQAVQGVVDLIHGHGHINADFNDVKAVMSERGPAVIGMGIASGPNRAIEAITKAITSPLLEDSAIEGAKGLLLNITGSSSMTMDEALEEQIRVTVIATGLDSKRFKGGIL